MSVLIVTNLEFIEGEAFKGIVLELFEIGFSEVGNTLDKRYIPFELKYKPN